MLKSILVVLQFLLHLTYFWQFLAVVLHWFSSVQRDYVLL